MTTTREHGILDRMRLLVLGGAARSTSALTDAVSALGAESLIVNDARSMEHALARSSAGCVLVDLDGLPADVGRERRDATIRALAERGVLVVAVGAGLDRTRVTELFAAGCRDVVAAPFQKREVILRVSATMHGKLRIACIGGGSGLFSVLSALKDVPRVLLSSIVTMSDDGGSSGRLRATFGVLPPGDIRRSLVALSNAPDVMNFVMQYRFREGGELDGHSLGNLLLTALSERTGGMQSAVRALGDVLNVQGIVMCVTERSTTLHAELEDGHVVRGESMIDLCIERSSDLRIRRVWHEPFPETGVDVFASIVAADVVVIGPGDLYTSILASLLVGGVGEALRRTRAECIYVCNMMTKPGETSNYDVADHAAAIVDAIGEDVLAHVLVSNTALDEKAVAEYAARSQHPVVMASPERLTAVTRANVVLADVGHRALLVRHDGEKLRENLLLLIGKLRPSFVVPGGGPAMRPSQPMPGE
ncbi:MAG: putative gluconeosis factor [Myxococcaceae bacterium]|nr:putative gluconeosis factor [Myxococcaceae bacterium]